LREVGLAALRIQIFIAQYQPSLILSGTLCGDPKCSRVPEVQ